LRDGQRVRREKMYVVKEEEVLPEQKPVGRHPGWRGNPKNSFPVRHEGGGR